MSGSFITSKVEQTSKMIEKEQSTEEISPKEQETDELTTEEILSHLEFGLWTAVVLIPILYWINGPSVSRDQLVVRTILAVVVYLGAPAIRLYRRRRSHGENGNDEIATPTIPE